MTVATTDGERVWGFRYSSEGKSRSLFFSTDVPTLRELHPEVEMLAELSRRDPADRLRAARRSPGAWNEVPESSYGVIQAGQDELLPFEPKAPSKPTSIPAQT